MHRSGSASTHPYTLPSTPYSRRDALDSYRGNKKLKKKWTHSERTVAVYSILWQREWNPCSAKRKTTESSKGCAVPRLHWISPNFFLLGRSWVFTNVCFCNSAFCSVYVLIKCTKKVDTGKTESCNPVFPMEASLLHLIKRRNWRVSAWNFVRLMERGPSFLTYAGPFTSTSVYAWTPWWKARQIGHGV